MSGPPGTALNMSSDVTEKHTEAVGKAVACEQSEDEAFLACLRSVPMETLLNAAMQYSAANHPPAGLFTFIPSVDGDMFPERPSVLYKAGRFVKGVPIVFGWAQDDGALNAGPAPLIHDEEDMKSSIRGFAPALDDSDFDTLFLLYSAKDFEYRVHDYELTKKQGDPEVPVHYFRLSQILRDMLFTCSSIDFGRVMHNHGPGVRLYALNQSMLTPLFEAAGMSYLGVAHGSDTNYIFNGIFPEGEISEADLKLSRTMTEALIRFAATSDPNDPKSGEEWPEAFGEQRLSVQIIGGPLGTGAGLLELGEKGRDGGMLKGFEMGAMESVVGRKRSEVLAREKLLARCEFVNSLMEKLGV
jgi:carboxylesterase type B